MVFSTPLIALLETSNNPQPHQHHIIHLRFLDNNAPYTLGEKHEKQLGEAL